MASVSRGRRLMGDINVVPYIDVMLVLLIIFMITAPLLTQGVKVDLPKAGAEPLDPEMLKNTIPLVLSVDRTGALYLNIGGGNPQTALDADTVAARAEAALRRNPELPVLVLVSVLALGLVLGRQRPKALLVCLIDRQRVTHKRLTQYISPNPSFVRR